MTRILTITSWYPPHHYGGYELSCFDVMRRLVERGHEVRILCGDERLGGAWPVDPDHEKLVHRDLRPHWREGSSWRPSLREVVAIERHNRRMLERHLAEFQPDVVSVWHMVAISMSLIGLLTELEVPSVYVVCDNWPVYGPARDPWTSMFGRGLVRSLAGRVVGPAAGLLTSAGDFGEHGAFCFVSQFTRDYVVADKPWSYSQATVVYSGIEPTVFPLGAAPPKPAAGWRLLYMGRLDAWKGVDTLLRALVELPQATLECYGRGAATERTRLAGLADELGITARVTFGSLERDELVARYSVADVVVFPSEWDEPFGLVPVEAMACGTPVIATGVGGSAEFLRDGYNCVLFTAGNAAALAAAVRRVHDDDDLRRELVTGGLHTAEQLDVDQLADALEGWHVAASERFVRGRPADRHLDLPPGQDAAVSCDRDRWPPPEVRRAVAERLGDIVAVRGDTRDAPRTTLTLERGPMVVTFDPARAGFDARSISVVADIESLPFRTGAFDAAASSGVFERLADDGAGAAELARVLKAGGLAVLAAPNRDDARIVRTRVRDRVAGLRRPARAYFHASDHLREYDSREFERVVGRALRVRARYAVGWERGRKMRIVSALFRLVPLRRFSQAIVVEAEAS